jgi:acyl-CoA synthetase (AMP-forming)/AMP-acid ligase II
MLIAGDGVKMALNKNMTMGDAFFQVADKRPDQEALICGEYRATYATLKAQVEDLTGGLHERGVRKGDKVGVLLPPGPAFAWAFFALARLGAVFVPLDPQIRTRRLEQVTRDAEPRLLISARSLTGEGFLDEWDIPEIIFLDGVSGGEGPTLGEVISAGKVSSISSSEVEVSPDDLLALLYTSGTTGTPKGTMHTHRSLIAPVAATSKVRELWGRPNVEILGQQLKALARYRGRLLRAMGGPMTFLSTMGWHSITGIEVLLQGLLMGDRLVVMPHFHPREALGLIEQEQVTIMIAVPMSYQVMLRLEGFEEYDTSSLIICGVGTAPCSPHLAEEIEETFGCATYIGFGATETGGGIAVSSLGDTDRQRTETVGKPLLETEVKVVDEEGRELPLGEVGELVCRSEGLMEGYYREPEMTAEVMDEEGWYHTGDLAKIDQEGYIHIVGRLKDLIIRGGQNIYPAEIEEYLTAHPGIREAAVVGVPVEVGGESVWAFVIPEGERQLTERDIIAYCREGLEVHMIPGEVRLVDDFPRAQTGKPQKYILRERAAAEKEGP